MFRDNQAVYDHVRNKWAALPCTQYLSYIATMTMFFTRKMGKVDVFQNPEQFISREVINTAAHASSNLEKTRHRWKGREMFEQQGVDRHFLYAHINSPAMLIPWESAVFSPLKVNSSWTSKILLKDKFIYFITPWWFKYNAKKNRFRWKVAAISFYKSEHFLVVFYFKNVRLYGKAQCFDY